MRKFDNIINETYVSLPSKILTEAEAQSTLSGYLRGLIKPITGGIPLREPPFNIKNYYVQIDRKEGLDKLRSELNVDTLKPTGRFDPSSITPRDVVIGKGRFLGVYYVRGKKGANKINVQLYDTATGKFQIGSTPILVDGTSIAGFYNPNADDPKEPTTALPTKGNAEIKAFNTDGSVENLEALAIALYNAFDASQNKLKHTPPELPSFTIEQLTSGEIYEHDKRKREIGLKKPAVNSRVAHQQIMSFIHNNPLIAKEIKYMTPEQLTTASTESLGKRILKGLDKKAGQYIQNVGQDLGQQLTKDRNVWL